MEANHHTNSLCSVPAHGKAIAACHKVRFAMNKVFPECLSITVIHHWFLTPTINRDSLKLHIFLSNAMLQKWFSL